MKTTYIYALIDPHTAQCRYVGKTVDLKNRFLVHCKASSKTYTANWVKSILPSVPIMTVLEEVVGDWVEAEQWWIAYFKFLGARLTNSTRGGEGNLGWSPSKETREKIGAAHRGRVWGQDYRDKLSAASRGKRSGEHNGFYGKRHSDETKAKISQHSSTKRHSAETLLKMSKAQKAYYAKLRAEGKRKSWTEEAKIKLSKRQRGVPKSPEHAEKIRQHLAVQRAKRVYGPRSDATLLQSICNSTPSKLSSRNKSGVRGVSWDPVNKKWEASFCVMRKVFRVGRYTTLQEAADAISAKKAELIAEHRDLLLTVKQK